MDDIEASHAQLLSELSTAIDTADNLDTLEAIRVAELGKKRPHHRHDERAGQA